MISLGVGHACRGARDQAIFHSSEPEDSFLIILYTWSLGSSSPLSLTFRCFESWCTWVEVHRFGQCRHVLLLRHWELRHQICEKKQAKSEDYSTWSCHVLCWFCGTTVHLFMLDYWCVVLAVPRSRQSPTTTISTCSNRWLINPLIMLWLQKSQK